MIIQKSAMKPIILDLTGTDANKFYLLSVALEIARKLKYSDSRINELMKKLQSIDHERLINSLDEEFGNNIIMML